MQINHKGRIARIVFLFCSVIAFDPGDASAATSILPGSAMSAPIVVQPWWTANPFMQTQIQNTAQRSTNLPQSDDPAAAADDDGEFHPLLDPLDAAEKRRH